MTRAICFDKDQGYRDASEGLDQAGNCEDGVGWDDIKISTFAWDLAAEAVEGAKGSFKEGLDTADWGSYQVGFAERVREYCFQNQIDFDGGRANP